MITRSTSRDHMCARQAAALTRALLESAASLGLGRRQLAKAIGVSETTIGRLARGERYVRQGSEQWELSLMLVSMYQALFSLVESRMRDWMTSHNRALERTPAESILTVGGLARTLSYLRGMSSLL